MTFYKSCYQPLVLVKVLSGLLLSQQGKEEHNLPQPLMFTKFKHSLTRLNPKPWWSLILKNPSVCFIRLWPPFKIYEIPSQHPKQNSSRDPQSKFPTTTLGDRQSRCIQIENNPVCSEHRFFLGCQETEKMWKPLPHINFGFKKWLHDLIHTTLDPIQLWVTKGVRILE